MTKPLRAVGIGDLHLDGKLIKHIPELNKVIQSEVEVVLNYAMRNGINLAFYYGDICDVPHLSSEATCCLLDLFVQYPHIKHILMPGNHDVENSTTNSLQLIKKLVTIGKLDNVLVVDSPRVLFRNRGTPVKILPWPHFDVEPDCLNILHIETNGSKWEIGKPIVSERETSYNCVSGHLHTHQVVGPQKNVFYSGTLYQTNFGEKNKKFFHDITWDGETLQCESVPHVPQYELINLIVTTTEDLKRIDPSPKKLYKVFVKSGVDLDASTFDQFSNVVKINSFKTREDLQTLIAEELVLSDANATVNSLSVMDALTTYLTRAKVESSVQDRAQEIANTLLGAPQ